MGGDREVKVKFVKYQNVTGLTLLVEDNHGRQRRDRAYSGSTSLAHPSLGMNVNELKKQDEH